ncbi:uncharacterized protein LOC105637970 [Jatropha curcas]|uniref:uncharacterized protein LOC105637970 n=1 Tax=Jatropha curcas TaxID=180498 RepID=UPI0005FB21E1|nr:uncharacterized protein LOC105637970 [Jatropha curcas]XP_020536369.1 uncharacterized protein LOC105637970 [Jatropha curcas]
MASNNSHPNSSPSPPAAKESELDSATKAACEEALAMSLEANKSEEAEKLIKEIVSRYKNMAYVHDLESQIHLNIALPLGIGDLDMRKKYLSDAVASAAQAVDLAPASVEYVISLAKAQFNLELTEKAIAQSKE